MRTRPCATTLEPEMTPGELSALKQWLQGASLKGRHLEIGTAAGGTLCFMMQCFGDRNRPAFSVVDSMSYFPDQPEVVRRNLRQHGLDPGTVDFRAMASAEAFRQALERGDRFSFILMDASHKIRHVMADLRWMRLLEPGGLACFHDYEPAFPGVTRPVDRFLRKNAHFTRVGRVERLLCIRKERDSIHPEVNPADFLWALAWSPLLQWQQSLRKRLNRR